jgi:hypothetical protein
MGRGKDIKRGGSAQFLEGVLCLALPPYRSDTSISFFFWGGKKGREKWGV